MARPLRIEYPGALYHITTRGDNRKKIFLNDTDRNNFLQNVKTTIERYNWLCHAYCLMDNHYHLLLETPEGNLSKGMRQLNGVYTQRFNFTHKTVGHLFQSRYKTFLIEKDPYLLEVARYIVLNPVRAGTVTSPIEWEWSSYLSTAGKEIKPVWLTTEWILNFFDNKISNAQKKYEQFVTDGIGKNSPFENVNEGIVLGFQQFVDWVRDTKTDQEKITEIPRIQRFVGRPSLEDLFDSEILKNKKIRDDLICFAHTQLGYSQKEIADYVDLHYTMVSKIINNIKDNKF
ncbi:transposase [Candidatus Uhrbacteria bacterium]|nr:transposase [Candidatus Uhrbacteria bacterium]